MKKSVLTSLFLLIFVGSLNAQAYGQNIQGGYDGPGRVQVPTTVAQVKDTSIFQDDIRVVLTGVITRSLGNEMYEFRDNTGTIPVEIDHDDWWGLTVTPTTTVIINGDIDNEFYGVSIDVDRIREK